MQKPAEKLKPATGRYVLYYTWDLRYRRYYVTWGYIKAVLKSGKILVSGAHVDPHAIVEIVKYESFEQLNKSAQKYETLTQSKFDDFINGNS